MPCIGCPAPCLCSAVPPLLLLRLPAALFLPSPAQLHTGPERFLKMGFQSLVAACTSARPPPRFDAPVKPPGIAPPLGSLFLQVPRPGCSTPFRRSPVVPCLFPLAALPLPARLAR